jgi:hypothetical protein
MRLLTLLAVLVVGCAMGSEPPFYGRPRDPMLREFWSGVQESAVNTKWFKDRCLAFAARHKAKITIPVLLHDFADQPGETKGFAYSWIMHGWPRDRVMALLKPYMRSTDRNMSYVASNCYADFESPD